MTDIEEKALALLHELDPELEGWGPDDVQGLISYEALCRAIEQHEAFRQEVSDAIDSSVLTPETEAHLSRFIIPKPDPLVEVLVDLNWAYDEIGPTIAADFCEALAKRGGKIVWENEQ